MMQSNTPKPPILQYSQLECSSLLRKLGVSSQGLSCDQVKQQRKRFGENVLQRKKHVLPSLLFRAFFTPFSIVLLVLTVISFVTDVLLVSNFSRSFTAPVIMFSMLLAGGGLRLTQELQAKRISEQLAGLARSRISVRRDGQMLGFVPLPLAFFAYMLPCILLYMLLATGMKKAYIRHYGELL